MIAGIDRPEMKKEVMYLDDTKLRTLTRTEARVLIDVLPEAFAELGDALDFAQGEDAPEGRYVVLYIEKGDLT